MEDLPWEVKCVNRITGESRDVPYGEFNEDRGYCNQPEEYKVPSELIAGVVVCVWYRPIRRRTQVSVRARGKVAVKNASTTYNSTIAGGYDAGCGAGFRLPAVDVVSSDDPSSK